MKVLIILITISLTTYALEHSASSNSSSSPRTPRSPREELGIIQNVDRIQDRDKKGRIVREFYSAVLASGAILTTEVIFDKKNNATYTGFWRRGKKPAQTMMNTCAEEYFGKLKLAYLQNNPLSQS